MKYGMVRAAAVTPTIKVGNPQNNAREISARIAELVKQGAEIIVFPELCVTGYTAADLFFSRSLLDGAIQAVKTVAAATPQNAIAFIGAPVEHEGRLYNCAVAVSGGAVIGVVPKRVLRTAILRARVRRRCDVRSVKRAYGQYTV